MADILDSTATTGSLTIGTDLTGTFDDVDQWDQDWYKVSLDADTAYKFTIDGENWPYLDVIDSMGNYIWENVYWDYGDDHNTSATGGSDKDGGNMSITFAPTSAGDYYISASGNDGDYTISSQSVTNTPDNYADTVANATILDISQGPITETIFNDYAASTPGLGSIDSLGDVDYFKIDLAEGKTYALKSNSHDVYVELVDEQGNYMWDDSTKWVEKGMLITPTQDKTYTFKVSSWTGITDYVLTAEELVVEDDNFADDVANAYELTLTNGEYNSDNDTNLDATINNSNDNDYFKVDLLSGETYVIQTDSWEYSIEMVDSFGNYMWDESVSWADNGYVITPSENKTYNFKVNSWGSMGDYKLTVKKAAGDDVGNTVSDATTFDFATNSEVSAKIDSSYDKDIFKVSVTKGEIYTISIDSDVWPYAEVLDANGNNVWNEVTWDWDNTTQQSTMTFTPSETKDYFVKVAGWESGDYTLKFEKSGEFEVLPDDHTNSTTGTFDTTNTFSNISSTATQLTGKIEVQNDKDVFQIDTSANKSYEIILNSEDSWPYIDVLDANGNYIWENVDWQWDPDANSKIVFTPSDNNQYYIQVSGWEAGEYTLDVKELAVVADDHTNSVTGTFNTANTFDSISTTEVVKTGELGTSFDKDYFKLSATSGKTYEIKLSDTDSAKDIWPYLEVQDGSGNYIWEGVDWLWSETDYNSGVRTHITFTPDESKDYFLKVDGWETGSYSVGVKELVIAEDDHANTIADVDSNDIIQTDGTIIKAELGDANTGLNDKDIFQITVEQNKSYEIVLDSDDIWPYLDILDGNGDYVWDGVQWDWDPDVKNKIVFTPTSSTNFYVRVDGWESGEYTLKVTELSDDHANSVDGDFDSDNTFSNVTTSGTTLEGSLETSSDIDMFKFTSDGSSAYEISLSSSEYIWPSLDVVDSNGNYIWENIDWQWSNDDNVKSKITFTPSDANDYFLRVNGWETGKYELSVKKIVVEADDHGNSVDDVNAADVFSNVDTTGSEKTGKLGTSSDKDFFKLEAIAGEIYTISLTTTDGTWPYLDIVDENGHYIWDEVSWEWDSTTTSKVILNASTSKDYFIKVDGWEISEYTLKVQKQIPVADDHTNSVEGTFDTDNTFDSVDTTGTTLDGNLETSYDKDVFKLVASAGDAYEISLNADNIWPYLEVLDSSGNYIWENIDWQWDENSKTKIVFTPLQAGEYFLKVDGWETGEYSVNVKKLVIEGDDHANNMDEATSLTLGTALTADLETSLDKDYFKFSATQGKAYEILLDSNEGWPYADVLDKDGNYLWENISWEWDSSVKNKLIFFADATDTFYVKVDSWESIDNYELTVSELAEVADDFVNTVEEAKTSDAIAVDGSDIDGELETSYDKDVFKLDASANSSYVITLDTTDNTWPYLDILDEDGNYVWENISWEWDSNYTSKIVFTPTDSDNYFIKVDGWEASEYTLNVLDSSSGTVADDFVASTSTTGVITVGDTNGTDGRLEVKGDIDWFKISLDNTKNYELQIDADFDWIIEGIYDASGNYIDGTYYDSSIDRFQTNASRDANSTADYYVAFSGHDTGKYNIKVTEFVSDATDKELDNTATQAITSVNSTYDGSIDFAYDEDWIKVRLEENKIYNFDLTGVTLDDTVINGIYDSNGRLLNNTFNDDKDMYTLDSHVTFTASSTGDYFVSVSSYDDGIGSYALSTTLQSAGGTAAQSDVDGADVNDTVATAISPNEIGSYSDGVIDYAGDTDMFKFTLEAGKTYDIGLYGSPTEHGTLVDTNLLGLYDSNGNLIANTSDDNGGLDSNSLIRYEVETSGDYYVKAGGADDLTGSFKVKVKQVTTNTQTGPVSTGFTEGDGSWTIMVYIAADNNLEAMGIDDINEMEAIDLPDNVHVTFLFDRVDGFDTSEGDWTGTQRGTISHDDDMYSISSAMEDIGEQNTGDGETLTEFIDWSTQTAAADNYALVVWNHGGGISGVAWDETSGYDNLTINEMTTAVQNSSVNNFEMIGFDACLQGVIDQSYAVKDVADVVVASEDLEPGDGWDYEGWFEMIANDSDGTVTTDEMATYVVDSYGEFYKYYSGTTQSAVKTDLLDEVTDAFKAFNDALTDMDAAEKTEFKAKASNLQTFGSYDEYMDLGDLAKMVDEMDVAGGTLDTKAAALTTAINNAVIANHANQAEPTGISIYYPGYTDQNYIDSFQVAQDTNITKLYDALNA